MPSAEFDKIKEAINDTGTSWAIRAKYKNPAGPDRKFLAYVLGGSPPGGSGGGGPPQEMVLGYQYEGPDIEPPPSPENWRCFKVALFFPASGNSGPVKVEKVAFAPSPPFPAPPELSNQEVARQNCVESGVPGSGKVIRSAPY